MRSHLGSEKAGLGRQPDRVLGKEKAHVPAAFGPLRGGGVKDDSSVNMP